jgi:diadenosine tetraphosphatase ApaH/serine/threonine PP2A family protein phosphatase
MRMRYAIISDIHSNLVALDACLAEIDRLGVETILCLGDIVGYGADPNGCVARVRERAAHVVLGNHDAAVAGRTDPGTFNGDARSAVEWTRAALAPEHLDYLKALPYVQVVDREILIVHSGPGRPPAWEYLFDVLDAEREFATFEQQLCFVGHTHFPQCFIESGGEVRQLQPPCHQLARGERALVNVGSVGQPRDGDARAAFGLYDGRSATIEIRRVQYDVVRVKDGIRAVELPASAATRLDWGV